MGFLFPFAHGIHCPRANTWFCLFLVFFLHGCKGTLSDSDYLIGLGSYDITGPAADVNMMGYANTQQVASGIHFRLRARTFIVADPQGHRVAFVNLDACMASQLVTIKVLERLKARYGNLYNEKNVAISGIHTHAGPGGYLQYIVYIVTSLGFVRQSFDVIVDGIEKSIIEAHENLRPGSIFINKGDLLDAGVNRSPSAYINNTPQEKSQYKYNVDKEMTLLKFVDDEWGPIGSFNWFATHGTSMSRTNSLISGDNKGAAARFMEDWSEQIGFLEESERRYPDALHTAPSKLNGFPRRVSSIIPDPHENRKKLMELAASFQATGGRPVKRSLSTTQRVRRALSEVDRPRFISAFCQSNCGDVSPNVLGAFCIDTGLPCDFNHSTCNGKNELCYGRGPGYPDEFESTRIIGDRQFRKAVELFNKASEQLHGKVDYHHTYLDFSNLEVSIPSSEGGPELVKTCPAAMGFAFAAGTTDGPGAFDFTQGDDKGNPFWRLVRDVLKTPNKEQIDCQRPKPILLDTGEMKEPYAWAPSILPIQILRIGQLVILSVPGEFTTMAGRRLRDAVKTILTSGGNGEFSSNVHIVIAGLTNSYSQYVTTFEEYQIQRYEGASTLFGPHTLNAYIQEFKKLATALIGGPDIEPGLQPPDLLNKQISLLPPVVVDTTPIGIKFGDMSIDVPENSTYGQGEMVTVTFWSACPRNDLLTQGTFALVEMLDSSGNWVEMLQTLDLSFNSGLTGPLSPAIGNLKQLTTLLLPGCSFSGNIPDELGNLPQLYFLALNSNKFTGGIPASLGKLSNLYWLDLSDNQLDGSLPVSTNTAPGLDQLLNAKHFHLSKNKLSGPIPPTLFSSKMMLLHILLDANQLNGSIPSAIGLVTTLEVLRLDNNLLKGKVPSSLSNLTSVNELHLADNQLSGSIPDLSTMSSLNYVDLSNNSFDLSAAPTWFTTLNSLTTLIIENGPLQGLVPQGLFSFPQLQTVRLKNNFFNGTLGMGNHVGQSLQLVDLEYNKISGYTVGSGYKGTLELYGNPLCNQNPNGNVYCQLQQQQGDSYSTSLASCGSKSCSNDKKLDPQSCNCAQPYQGTFLFKAASFSDLSNSSRFRELEVKLWTELSLTPGSVYLGNISFDADQYLQIHVELFPPDGEYFTRLEVQLLGFRLTNQTFKPPDGFGPYLFYPLPYNTFADETGGTSMSKGVIAAIAVGCVVVVLVLAGVAVYAFMQKKRAERAIELSKPFASWAPSGTDGGGVPQLKGARWFSYNELKKITSNFAESNEIGSGGYGKVYRGLLPGGQVVAIKRAQQGSTQGGLEFKTEIELLSRVHHKNLVGLVGFCFEQGEQMLVYEYIPNGTLRETLSGRSGIFLDWKRRLRVALGSARGISYLHDLANPPIIHRDIKSTNILLDENLTAKVADFGLSKLVADSEKGHVSTQVKGTLGYLDPEYYMTQQLTDKSDVYSFGVVMLELITAKQPIEKGKYVVREVRMAIDKQAECYGLKEMMDPAIRNANNLIGFERFVELAMRCVEESAAERPAMSEVVKEFETILQNDGMNTVSTSASSSATDFGTTKGAPRHPYDEPLPKTLNSNSFDYSGGYSYSAKIESSTKISI